MFEKYLIHPEGFSNIRKNKRVVGYEVQFRIPYYRGIPMSCVQELRLSVDDQPVNMDNVEIIVKGDRFKYSEISTAINHRWEMTDTISLFVEKDAGLSDEAHKINGFVGLRISYQPHPNIGEDEKILKVGMKDID